MLMSRHWKRNFIKEVFQFGLVLKEVDQNTDGLEDALYKTGCDDVLINFSDALFI